MAAIEQGGGSGVARRVMTNKQQLAMRGEQLALQAAKRLSTARVLKPCYFYSPCQQYQVHAWCAGSFECTGVPSTWHATGT
jgi:hypothetical protein